MGLYFPGSVFLIEALNQISRTIKLSLFLIQPRTATTTTERKQQFQDELRIYPLAWNLLASLIWTNWQTQTKSISLGIQQAIMQQHIYVLTLPDRLKTIASCIQAFNAVPACYSPPHLAQKPARFHTTKFVAIMNNVFVSVCGFPLEPCPRQADEHIPFSPAHKGFVEPTAGLVVTSARPICRSFGALGGAGVQRKLLPIVTPRHGSLPSLALHASIEEENLIFQVPPPKKMLCLLRKGLPCVQRQTMGFWILVDVRRKEASTWRDIELPGAESAGVA